MLMLFADSVFRQVYNSTHTHTHTHTTVCKHSLIYQVTVLQQFIPSTW